MDVGWAFGRGRLVDVSPVCSPLHPQGTRKVVSSDLLTAEDPDTAPAALVYTQLNADPARKGQGHGQLEWTATPGTAIASFTQQDVNEGKVSYAHRGERGDADTSNAKLTLQVRKQRDRQGDAFLVHFLFISIARACFMLVPVHTLTPHVSDRRCLMASRRRRRPS